MSLRFILHWITFSLTYLLFAGKLSYEEAIAAGASGLIGALVTRSADAHLERRFELEAAWLVIVLRRVPARALKDCAVVLRELLQSLIRREPLEGVLITIPFDPGGDDPKSATRRALVASAITVAPNSIAVLVNSDHGQMLIHQLYKTPSPPGGGDREWPL